MTPKAPPNYSEKRKILFSKTMPAEEIDKYGQAFLDVGRLSDALDLFEKSGNKEKVEDVAAKAREAGDPSIWLRAKKMLGETPTPEMWEGIAEQALAFGKENFAAWAFDQAGMKDRAAALRSEWHRRTVQQAKVKEEQE
ncbi:MAG: hypothetical protein GXP25_22215 [Planctomycetes bacterium]|nr:hypothetical protein [Planctomycetota bacterium]